MGRGEGGSHTHEPMNRPCHHPREGGELMPRDPEIPAFAGMTAVALDGNISIKVPEQFLKEFHCRRLVLKYF